MNICVSWDSYQRRNCLWKVIERGVYTRFSFVSNNSIFDFNLSSCFVVAWFLQNLNLNNWVAYKEKTCRSPCATSIRSILRMVKHKYVTQHNFLFMSMSRFYLLAFFLFAAALVTFPFFTGDIGNFSGFSGFFQII